MKIAAVSFSAKGFKLAQSLEESGIFTSVTGIGKFTEKLKLTEKITLSEWTKSQFFECDALVFISSCGIAVRAVSKYIESKKTDPAVIVIDESAKFVISLLSGHLGGANSLSKKIADILGAQAVITTATDLRGILSVDSWANHQGFVISDINLVKTISARLLEDEPVGIVTEVDISGSSDELTGMPGLDYGICISYSMQRKYFANTLYLIPKDIVIGIGCRRDTPFLDIENALLSCLEKNDIDIRAVKYLASIDLKKNESGIIEFCSKYSIEFITFSEEQLSDVDGSDYCSEFVKSVTGVGNVCERASLALKDTTLISRREVFNKVTTAISRLRREYSFEY